VGSFARLPWRLRYYTAAALASRWRRRLALMTHGHAEIAIDRTARLGPRFGLWIPQRGTLSIGPGCELRRDFFAEIHGEGRVEIGPQTVFTGQSALQISTTLTIGERCVLGIGTMIVDGNHRFRDHTKHTLDQGYDYRPIEIGDGALILSKCTIVASIGKGAVIGSNSVVTRPVPDYCLAAGAPARVIEYFGPPEDRPDIPDLDKRRD
jgi:acetyltransferase-like isoleucine patch superfamily enzyme